MASAQPLRGDDGAGAVIPGACFVNLVYVVPERWGQGIGGVILGALLEEARLQGFSRAQLWTHEQENEHAHRLYRRHGFSPTGRTREADDGAVIGEWAREAAETQD